MRGKYIYFKQKLDSKLNTGGVVYTTDMENIQYQLYEFKDFTWEITIGTALPSKCYVQDQWELRNKVKHLTGREIAWI